MKTGYKTSKSPYEDIHFGDIVERYPGSGEDIIVWRLFGVYLKPIVPKFMRKESPVYRMLKVDRIINKKNGNKNRE